MATLENILKAAKPATDAELLEYNKKTNPLCTVVKSGRKTYRVSVFDSLHDMLNVPVASHSFSHFRSTCVSRYGDQSDWWGVPGADELATAIETGWTEGAEKIEKSIGKLDEVFLQAPAQKQMRRRRARSDQGDSIDMQRVYAGQLDQAWSRMIPAERDGKKLFVDVVVNVASHCGRNQSEFFWRGALAIQIADALEARGVRVRILAGHLGQSVYYCDPQVECGEDTETETTSAAIFGTVKNYDEPVNKPHLAAMLSLAGVFRTVMWKPWFSHVNREVAGLGRPDTFAANEKIAEHIGAGKSDCILVENVWTESKAKELLEKIINDYS